MFIAMYMDRTAEAEDKQEVKMTWFKTIPDNRSREPFEPFSKKSEEKPKRESLDTQAVCEAMAGMDKKLSQIKGAFKRGGLPLTGKIIGAFGEAFTEGVNRSLGCNVVRFLGKLEEAETIVVGINNFPQNLIPSCKGEEVCYNTLELPPIEPLQLDLEISKMFDPPKKVGIYDENHRMLEPHLDDHEFQERLDEIKSILSSTYYDK